MTVEFGYAISSEEHGPTHIVRHAARAEELGFTFAGISDHYHPWIRAQGHSPFVWTVAGAIAQATERMRLGTGVTCPMVRMHPAIIAQAAATTACLMPGRFFLGLGSGEALNEHILGQRWPPAPTRLEMLEEAVEVIRLLWAGGSRDHRGRFYTVEDATVFDLPEPRPEIVLAAAGPKAASLAGRVADAFWGTTPDAELIETFEREGGKGKPRYAKLTVCWAADEAQARGTAHHVWPNTALPGQLGQDLPTPGHFEEAVKLVTEDDVARRLICGPDVARYVRHVEEYLDAGYSHLYFHQVGPDQEGFFRFWESELQPALAVCLRERSGTTASRQHRSENQTESQAERRSRTMGVFEEAKGKAKEVAGELVNDPDLAREGQAQKAKGEEEREATEARAEAKAHDAKAKLHEVEQEAAESRK